ncbi:uncharacterized protein BXZ73DRAFT_101942 [Epithele typhae]|uniref:uncharacterized protein n=1 Tax=Epithele typhae TaxID=378194 RepID=UPI0020078949|nr:uncharacterized protein BXZ73DRAFT_101942 [Epithele typhae]KAH9929877.1 hypothetical protein BXZ73DRAFT_101942 [Epithele typhae]
MGGMGLRLVGMDTANALWAHAAANRVFASLATAANAHPHATAADAGPQCVPVPRGSSGLEVVALAMRMVIIQHAQEQPARDTRSRTRRVLPAAKLIETAFELRSQLKTAWSIMHRLLKQNKRRGTDTSDIEDLDPGISDDEDDDGPTIACITEQPKPAIHPPTLCDGDVCTTDSEEGEISDDNELPDHDGTDHGDEGLEDGELASPDGRRTPPSPPKEPPSKWARKCGIPWAPNPDHPISTTFPDSPHLPVPPQQPATSSSKTRKNKNAFKRKKCRNAEKGQAENTPIPHNALPRFPKSSGFTTRYSNTAETTLDDITVKEYRVDSYAYTAICDPVKTRKPPTLDDLDKRGYTFVD